LAENPSATGIGADISDAALAVARENATMLSLTDRVDFVTSDWFGAIDGQFDLILSNPPYITDAEMAALAPDVRDWEPHLALTPGGDGLGPYHVIARYAATYLTPKGRIILEFGTDQGAEISDIFTKAGFDVELRQDYAGHDRNIIATLCAD
jgi:release factor glutamine methyltransferase